ncbi:hypothetical protein TURU_167209 [Turdus rufiventris]|nr:hypothetical protein TURU_167209 [Turdus rufiventris]
MCLLMTAKNLLSPFALEVHMKESGILNYPKGEKENGNLKYEKPRRKFGRYACLGRKNGETLCDSLGKPGPGTDPELVSLVVPGVSPYTPPQGAEFLDNLLTDSGLVPQIAELAAVVRAFEKFKDEPFEPFNLVTDSAYVAGLLSESKPDVLWSDWKDRSALSQQEVERKWDKPQMGEQREKLQSQVTSPQANILPPQPDPSSEAYAGNEQMPCMKDEE